MGKPGYIKVLICDDDVDVHLITKIALHGFDFEGQRLDFIDCFSAAEAQDCLIDHPDVALVVLDIAMESEDAGLQLVAWIRKVLKNSLVRIIIRTGLPDATLEMQVVRDYEVNGYWIKTELNTQKLYAAFFSALRSWQELSRIEATKDELRGMIKMGVQLFTSETPEIFFRTLMEQLAWGLGAPSRPLDGFLTLGTGENWQLVYTSGRFLHEGKVDELSLSPWVPRGEDSVQTYADGLVFRLDLGDLGPGLLYLGCAEGVNLSRGQAFLPHLNLAIQNYRHVHYFNAIHDDVLFTTATYLENLAPGGAYHLLRLSSLVAAFAQALGWAEDQVEELRIASILHDVGKTRVPGELLVKKEALEPSEWKIVKNHAKMGWDMLAFRGESFSRLAASMALSHHENWDGSGYPQGLRAHEIPQEARILALADALETMTRERSYGRVYAAHELLGSLKPLSGVKFDPELFRIFEDKNIFFLKILEGVEH